MCRGPGLWLGRADPRGARRARFPALGGGRADHIDPAREPDARYELASTIAGRLRPKVSGVSREIGSEDFLEQLVLAKSQRT